jgi:hypothetical protein
MALASSHSHATSSTSSRYDDLQTLSLKAEHRAQVLERLAADLRRLDLDDLHGDKRLLAVCEVLLNGAEADLDGDDLATIERLKVRTLPVGEKRRRVTRATEASR